MLLHFGAMVRQLGGLNAALAHTLLEDLFPSAEPGVSALRAFAYALAQGLRLYTLEGPEGSAALDSLGLAPDLHQ